jgi:translation initiation factor 1A
MYRNPRGSPRGGRKPSKGAEYDETSEEITRCPMPYKPKHEIFGIANQLLGASKIKVLCEDGKARLGRIPGKIRRRMWIREGDLLILRPWEFQDEKADIIYRYTLTQAKYLSRTGRLPEAVRLF